MGEGSSGSPFPAGELHWVGCSPADTIRSLHSASPSSGPPFLGQEMATASCCYWSKGALTPYSLPRLHMDALGIPLQPPHLPPPDTPSPSAPACHLSLQRGPPRSTGPCVLPTPLHFLQACIPPGLLCQLPPCPPRGCLHSVRHTQGTSCLLRSGHNLIAPRSTAVTQR